MKWGNEQIPILKTILYAIWLGAILVMLYFMCELGFGLVEALKMGGQYG